jgi:hypothetical protein
MDPYSGLVSSVGTALAPAVHDVVAVAALVMAVLVAITACRFIFVVVAGKEDTALADSLDAQEAAEDPDADTGIFDRYQLSDGDVESWE